MSAKTTNSLSKYFGDMEKKPLRKGELKHIFEQLADRSSEESKVKDFRKAVKKEVAIH